METVNRITMFVVLLLVQVLILNHIHLFQIATPMLYVYFVVTFRMDTVSVSACSLTSLPTHREWQQAV